MPDIFQSLYNHDLPNIIKYLERGGDINAVDEEGCPLLVRAIMLEHLDVSMHLIQAGADVNKTWTIAGQERPEMTALIHAVINAWVDVTDALLARNADVNVLDMRGDSALHWAVVGADPQEMQRTFDCYTICKKLLSAGADPNIQLGHGPTPLSEAVEWPIRFSFAKELIRAGGDINILHDPLANIVISDEDLEKMDITREEANLRHEELRTPLAVLVDNHITEVTDHVRDGRGGFRDTGRYLESSFDNNIEQILFLLDHGADVHAKSEGGTSAFDLVRFRKRQDLDAVFEEFFPKKPSLTVVRGGKV